MTRFLWTLSKFFIRKEDYGGFGSDYTIIARCHVFRLVDVSESALQMFAPHAPRAHFEFVSRSFGEMNCSLVLPSYGGRRRDNIDNIFSEVVFVSIIMIDYHRIFLSLSYRDQTVSRDPTDTHCEIRKGSASSVYDYEPYCFTWSSICGISQMVCNIFGLP